MNRDEQPFVSYTERRLVALSEGKARNLSELSWHRAQTGENGYQTVKKNFLITRHLKDNILVLLALEHPNEDVVNLG